MNDILYTARSVQKKTANSLAAAVYREQNMLRAAFENHSSMPDNYWHERHKLTQQVRAINAIVEVLEEEQHA